MNVSAILQEIRNELQNILKYWSQNTIDDLNGGFVGAIDFYENKKYEAEKGSVMYGRILWTFSASYPITKNKEHFDIAKRAYLEIRERFYNPQTKGIYWSINADGTPKDTKNQIYALAFVIYGLSEFYKIAKDDSVLNLAITLYESIQKYSFDTINKGYFEAYTHDWKEIEDMRLSDKDANEKKTMNTHLHIVEAFANLYLVWKNEVLKQNIVQLLETIDGHFIDKKSWHLKLFFDENWKEKKDVISYGHDIEAAWLLQWCAEVIEDKDLIASYKDYAVKMADATMEGLDEDGGLWYEYEPESEHLIAEKHWWPQAELWIGFLNAYQLTNDKRYFDVFEKNIEFTSKYIIDKKNGEWIWGIDESYQTMQKDKAGFWKCPYHNGRACLEVLQRIQTL